MAIVKKASTKPAIKKAKPVVNGTVSPTDIEALKKAVAALKSEVAILKKSLSTTKLESGNKDIQLRNAVLDWAQGFPTTRVYSNFVKNGITRS